MFVRVVAVDPNPPDKNNDMLIYQVPENSRAMKVLTGLFETHNIEWVTLCSHKKDEKKRRAGAAKPCEGCGRRYHRGPARDCPTYLEKKGIM